MAFDDDHHKVQSLEVCCTCKADILLASCVDMNAVHNMSSMLLRYCSSCISHHRHAAVSMDVSAQRLRKSKMRQSPCLTN